MNPEAAEPTVPAARTGPDDERSPRAGSTQRKQGPTDRRTEPVEPVLITGAAGKVGMVLREAFSDRKVHLLDRDMSRVEPTENEVPFEGEIEDLDLMCRAAEGTAAMVHLAANPNVPATWPELRTANFDGAYNAFEAARVVGVGRVVFASTNHVTGMLDQQKRWPIEPYGEVAPDSLYGASKAFGEALGRYYSDNFGLSVICLRIGWMDTMNHPDDPDWRRMWLSYADLSQLVLASVDSDVRFGIYYGMSANTPMQYDMENAHRELGYRPVDDSANVLQGAAAGG